MYDEPIACTTCSSAHGCVAEMNPSQVPSLSVSAPQGSESIKVRAMQKKKRRKYLTTPGQRKRKMKHVTNMRERRRNLQFSLTTKNPSIHIASPEDEAHLNQTEGSGPSTEPIHHANHIASQEAAPEDAAHLIQSEKIIVTDSSVASCHRATEGPVNMVSILKPQAAGVSAEPLINLICADEELSESQQKVYAEWDKQVKEYDDLMKKHKEEEEKYQKAVKAVDTRVGLKDSEHQVANGPTKFLRAVPTSTSTVSNQSKSVVNNSFRGRVIPSVSTVPNPLLQRTNTLQTARTPVNGRQQLAYGGNQLTGRQQITTTTSSGIKMTLSASQQTNRLPGVMRPGSYVIHNGIAQATTKVVQPGVTVNNQQRVVNIPTDSLQTYMKQSIQNVSAPIQRQPATQNVSRGVKRPAEVTLTALTAETKRPKRQWIPRIYLYYPMKKGNLVQTEDASKRFKIKCFHCEETMASNVQYATHVKKIAENLWANKTSLASMVVCPKCFKRFRTPFEMQEHLERSHMKGSMYQCFTCDLSFSNISMLLKHMNMFHSVAQMPFCCRICQYRTSAYADIIEHFSLKHEGYKALMCPYCLKMLRCSKTFLQHCQRHIQLAMRATGSGVYPCKNCKLSFLSTIERNEHLDKDHRKYDYKDRDGVPRYVRDTLKSLEIMASAGVTNLPPTHTISPKKVEIKYGFTQQASLNKKLACMECGLLFPILAVILQSSCVVTSVPIRRTAPDLSATT
ncbi:LOW QUALITY PROTEIN: zinc finger protein 280B-like [Strongylocentrotus purpuratus]|uniref:C2H2-type domain-containing protein n=1 Tax=Strongylocentrotus purpuratus TaxID=7668 RepID=A0A7M7MZU7_STRPU|nr:LOW QUALITY PROTEIN: zinc finger protein 280B-like [Strongylocentrotus purpuratus]